MEISKTEALLGYVVLSNLIRKPEDEDNIELSVPKVRIDYNSDTLPPSVKRYLKRVGLRTKEL